MKVRWLCMSLGLLVGLALLPRGTVGADTPDAPPGKEAATPAAAPAAESAPATEVPVGPSKSQSAGAKLEDTGDPAFERYVDLALAGKAWADLDARLLTDVALQLAEGERILLRSHKAFSADKVLEKAAHVAIGKKDKAALERLAKVLEKRDLPALKAQVSAAMKLAASSRTVDPAMLISVEQTSPQAFAAYQRWMLDIQATRLSGDRAALDEVEKSVSRFEGLAPAMRDAILKRLSEARSAIPKDAKPDATAEALAKLATGSSANGEERGVSPESPESTLSTDLNLRPLAANTRASDSTTEPAAGILHKLSAGSRALVTVPNVANGSQEGAFNVLRAAGLNGRPGGNRTEITNDRRRDGRKIVIGTQPPAGKRVPRGSLVTVLTKSYQFVEASLPTGPWGGGGRTQDGPPDQPPWENPPPPPPVTRSSVAIANPGDWGGPVNYRISFGHGRWLDKTLGDGMEWENSGPSSDIRIKFDNGKGAWHEYDLNAGWKYLFRVDDDGNLDLSDQ